MIDELVKLLVIFCIGQGVTFSTLLLFKTKGVVVANRLLAVFILFTMIPLWNDIVLIEFEIFAGMQVSFGWLYIAPFYGPLLYLCTFYYIGGQTPSKQTWCWLAFLPFVGIVVKSIQTYFIDGYFSSYVWFSIYGLVYIQIALCTYFGLRLVWKLETDLKQNLSNLDKAKTTWLKQLLIIYFVVSMVSLVHIVSKLAGTPYTKLIQVFVTISESIFIFILGFWGFNKSNTIFHDLVVVEDKKYKNSTLNKQKSEQIILKLSRIMETEELYLDNDISLLTLSDKLNESPHNVSQALNESLQLNFYDYINSARISRAKELLKAPEFSKLAIMDVAYQVGFNNKTSFNNSFKKFTNKTPSQYRTEVA